MISESIREVYNQGIDGEKGGIIMVEEKETKKGPSESFAKMMKEFGNAMAEIFNDPQLKEKAKEFGESAAASARAFADRFKDEEVKSKFKDLGKAAKSFSESMADYFKDNKEKPEQKSSQQEASSEESKKKPESTVSSNSIKEVNEGTLYRRVEEAARDRNARITGYSFAIAWSIVLIIFFNFFNRYIAYYEYDTVTSSWSIFPFITEGFNAWLPVLNASLLITIIGNVILIINDSFYFSNITNIVMHAFGIASVSTLLSLFPFDFSVVPDINLNSILFPVIKIVLILIIVGLSIGILVRFIKIIVKVSKST
jgi:hypothetical protein